MALIKDYFKKTEELKRDYGNRSIVLIQVGAFYEVYGLYENKDNDCHSSLIGSNINEFSSKCELNISKKNVCVGSQPVAMAGFRDYMLDKYLNKLRKILLNNILRHFERPPTPVSNAPLLISTKL